MSLNDIKRISGLLPINKEQGKISKDVERDIVSRFGKMKIGHIGTLDPMASGVLPLLFGEATKFQDYSDTKKVYRIKLCLGILTDSYDSMGKLLEKKDPTGITEEDISRVIKKYIGDFYQIPPIYSAVKFKGKALYSYAVKGQKDLLDMNQFKRKVSIYDIKIEDFSLPYVDLRVECLRGTYMRSLAYDIGQELGCGACLSMIERLYSSGIDLSSCINLSEVLKKESIEEVAKDYMVPIRNLKLGIKDLVIDLDSKSIERLFNGVKLSYLKEDFIRSNGRKDGLFLFKNRDKVGVVEVVDGLISDKDSAQDLDSNYVIMKLRRGIC